jgi:hypothetical protein
MKYRYPSITEIRDVTHALCPAKVTARFVKGLLKDPSHRNNMTYWSVFTHYSSESQAVLRKLLSTPLSPYHAAVFRNKLTTCQDSGVPSSADLENFDVADRKIEELICKPIAR